MPLHGGSNNLLHTEGLNKKCTQELEITVFKEKLSFESENLMCCLGHNILKYLLDSQAAQT